MWHHDTADDRGGTPDILNEIENELGLPRHHDHTRAECTPTDLFGNAGRQMLHLDLFGLSTALRLFGLRHGEDIQPGNNRLIRWDGMSGNLTPAILHAILGIGAKRATEPAKNNDFGSAFPHFPRLNRRIVRNGKFDFDIITGPRYLSARSAARRRRG